MRTPFTYYATLRYSKSMEQQYSMEEIYKLMGEALNLKLEESQAWDK